MDNIIFNRKRIINYIIFFGTIFIFFWLNGIYINLKTSKNMLPVTINIIVKEDIFNNIEVYKISPKHNIEKYSKDFKKGIFFFNNYGYISKLRFAIPSNNFDKINKIEVKIGKRIFNITRDKLLSKSQLIDNNNIINLEINDFTGLQRSIIPLFRNVINWPGDFRFFIFNYLLFFLSTMTFSIIVFFGEIIIKKRFPSILENKKILNGFYFLIITFVFNISYLQTYIYRFNQHTKFLHGLAKAGFGFLKNDWLANTIDPLPVFSYLIFFTYRFLHEYFFYFYYFLILGIFICYLLSISFDLFKIKKLELTGLIISVLVIFLHSNFFHDFTKKHFGFSITNIILKDGVAGQYLLGNVFQPCVFGVFILLSIYLFLNKKVFLSIIFLLIPSYFHTAYLYSSGILTLSYLLIIYIEEKNLKKIIYYGSSAFILILPILIHNYIYLNSTSGELNKTAMNIIVNIRNPHHMVTMAWIDVTTFIKMFIIIFAIFIIRKSRIFFIIALPFLITLFLTILQIFIKNDFIGFLTPWRISAWLVPISTTIIISFIISRIFYFYTNRLNLINNFLKYISLLIILIPFVYGLNILIEKTDDYLNEDHGKMLNYVKDNKSSEDIYLVPLEMEGFRLDTGTPVFVTYRSHPYKDIEVMEWYNRIKKAEEFYKSDDINKYKILNELKDEKKVTHVLLQKDFSNNNYNNIIKLYNDEEYIIYKIK